MKSYTHTVSKLLASALLAISVLSMSSCNGTGTTGTSANTNSGGTDFNGASLPIAYINVDSLLVNYNYAKDINEDLTKKMEDMRLTVNQKTKKLEADMNEFQRKVQNNAFLSEDRMQQEYNRLQKQDAELQTTFQRMQQEWGMEQQKVNMQIADSVRQAVKQYNETAKFQIIFNMRELDNIILANEQFDITKDVLTVLNSRYTPAAKK